MQQDFNEWHGEDVLFAVEQKVDYRPLFQFWQSFSSNYYGFPLLLARLFGYQNLPFDNKESRNRSAGAYLIPKFDLIFNPAKALEENQFYSIFSMIVNPLTTPATGLSIASQNLKDKIEDTGEKKYMVRWGFLQLARGPIGALALAINVIETLVTYAVLASLALATLPIWLPAIGIAQGVKAVRKHREAKQGYFAEQDNAHYHQMQDHEHDDVHHHEMQDHERHNSYDL